jgi:quercetin dioxygenase-like cupin family protein
MKVNRFSEATRYDAPNHRAFMDLCLQGFESDGPKNQWGGISHFHPGGGAGPDSSPCEKVYVCLVGGVRVDVDGVEFVLNPMDSCTVAPNEVREIVNHQNHLATTLVVMPYTPA